MNSTNAPLAGMKVLEFTHVASGPFTGQLLADLGADVVKVEPPTGDQMRQWPPIMNDPGASESSYSYNFASLNRSKRSIALDLKNADDLETARALACRTDVIVENYRPGVLDKLGLGFDWVSEQRTGIIYCSISGFGLSSPWVNRGAFDVVIQGMSGLMSVTGERGGQPTKSGVPFGDFVAGLYAALTISSYWRGAADSRENVRLDVPMLDCLVATAALQTSEYWGTGQDPIALGSAHPRNAPYQAFEACDGHFTIAAGNDRLWERVCEAIDTPTLAMEERFATQALRASNQNELASVLTPIFKERSVAHWLDRLAEFGIPSGPVLSFSQLLEHEHARSTGLVADLPAPSIPSGKTVVYPVRTVAAGTRSMGPPPSLDGNREEILDEWLG